MLLMKKGFDSSLVERLSEKKSRYLLLKWDEGEMGNPKRRQWTVCLILE